MALDTGERKKVTYFTGNEVEHTIAHGLYTLFVVGTPSIEDILYKAMRHKVKQIYFGSSQSFNPENEADWERWDAVIKRCLENDSNYFVALDFDVKYAEELLEYGWCENTNFIPMISVKLPYLAQLGYNATVKIDDNTWGHSNPGVWTHHLHELTCKKNFTSWHEYSSDSVLNADENTDDKFLTLT